MGAFKVLMWKHYTVRKRRWFQTFVEFVAPISIIIVLFILKDSMLEKAVPGRLEEESFSLDYSDTSPLIVYEYEPHSEATRKLMNVAYQSLNLPLFKGLTKVLTFISTPNPEPLKSEKLRIIVIKFENMTGDSLPDRLDYTIGLKPFYESSVPVLRSYEKIESFDKSLLKLQWAIDSSFLELKTNSSLQLQNITFEKLSESRRANTNFLYVNTVFLLLPYMSFLAPLLPFIFLMIRLLEERSSGIQELVKMVGVTPAMLGITQFLNTLPTCLIFSSVSTVLMKIGDHPMVPATLPVILFTGLFLHFVSIIALAYACSYMCREAQFTVSLSMFVYLGMWIPIRLLEPESKSKVILFFLGLLPHCPTYWYLNEIHNMEIYFDVPGIHFGNWNVRHGYYKSGGQNGSLMCSYLMQLLQITLFFTISWYLERVRPGKYGIALPLTFPCQREYWRKHHNIPEKSSEVIEPYDPAYQKFFEVPPKNMEAGISISHVSKIFGSGKKQFQALNNVTLDIYKGEITVLLGHNGAGKTTLMNIITGMINPTVGKIYVNGMDTVTQQVEVRKHLGLCPQHNLFFPDLTVKEHLLFFSMIKGGKFAEANSSSRVLMEQLNLTEKKGSKTSELSGGMLRRLQLGCALCGNASVLILDEPTSGLDVEARRELWDMLLAMRGNRTLLLTTHFMEEADVLGDRLAALHGGRLRSHATPMFVKRAVGSGFRLSITTIGKADESKITQSVCASVPSAILKDRSANHLTYILPADADMSTLFQNLEGMKQKLDIQSVSVGITSLEEVFLELCCDVDAESKTADDPDAEPVPFTYVNSRFRLYRQLCALLKRQYDYTMSKKIAFFILQIAMPMVMCSALTDLFNNVDMNPYSAALNADIYSDGISKKAMYRIMTNNTLRSNAIDVVKESYPDIEFRRFEDIAPSCICQKMNEHYNSFLVGVDINDTKAKILHKPSVRHTASVGLNLLSNILAVQTMSNADGKTVTTRVSNVYPLQGMPKIHIPKTKMNCTLFAIFNIFILMSTAINDVTLPCRERLTVVRHTHIMAGCPPVLYWLATFIYHMCGYLLFSLSSAMIACAFFDDDKTINDKDTLIAYAFALVLCGMSFYSFQYFVSYYFNERGASMLLIGLTIIIGFFSPILMMGLDDLKSVSGPEPIYNRIMGTLGVMIPAHMITDVIARMTDTSRFNSFCKHNINICPNLPYFSDGFDLKKCCSEGSAENGPFNHFAFNKFAMGWPLLVVAVQFVIFTTLVLLLEYKVFNRWWNRLARVCVRQLPDKMFDSQPVNEEKEYVEKTIGLPTDQITDTLLVNNTWKTYYKLYGKPTFALRDANIAVKKGECFGILGVNGAGKTTTFKLISHEEAVTKGNVYVKGQHLKENPTKYMRHLGYCPQFCGLDDFRTGANNLRLLLIMRGLTDGDVKRETYAWLNVVGMRKHGDRIVGGYSGGMVRRLATAASLCSGSPLTLLDEPSSGVDTAARRLVWVALQRGMMNDRAIVLSSHSMDEMELLCRRVTILSQGEMCVLGTPAALRLEHAAGHSVLIKLRVSAVQAPGGKERVQELKSTLEQRFNCSLKDEHLTTLHYRINEKLEYSDIFGRIEAIGGQFSDLVEDYSVADTTLEDVFLNFASK